MTGEKPYTYTWEVAAARLKIKREIRCLASEKGLLDKLPSEVLDAETEVLKFILEILKNED